MVKDVAWRRVTAATLGGLLTIGGFAVLRGEPAGSPPDWLQELGTKYHSQTGPWHEATSAPLGNSKGTTEAKHAFPDAQRWEVHMGQKTGRVVEVESTRVGAAAGGAAAGGAAAGGAAAGGAAAGIEVFDNATARRVGVNGFLFQVSRFPHAETVKVSVDYSAFASAYGSSYADRLRLVAMPDCAAAGCRTPGKELRTINDTKAHRLTAELSPSTSDSMMLAATSGVGGDQGTYAATPMSITGTWQVSPGSGAFTYSYPIDVPRPPVGSAPSVAMSYSSAVIDGMTLAANTQASAAGTGWSDFANAFIERRYEPCYRNVGTADLCWKSDNATLSLGGIAGPLVPVNAAHTQWRLVSDPGWLVERLTGAPYTNIYQKQYWKVTGPDGTKYFFGYGHMPGTITNSTLAVPVLADNPGEPCRTADNKVGSCDQGWRWYLDRVVDPKGYVQSYVYERQHNWYSAIGGLAPNTRYDRAALLKDIYYGGTGWDSSNYTGHVKFGLEYRCAFLVANCPAAVPGSTSYVDVPVDLLCTQSDPCSVHAPSFFTDRRYAWVRTEVKSGGAWKPIAQHNIHMSFGDTSTGAVQKLQVDDVQHAAIAFGKLSALPSTTFGYSALDNRADNDGNIPKAMRHHRMIKITNPFGGVTNVSYGMTHQCAKTYNPWPRWDLNAMDCFPQSIKDGDFTRTGLFYKWLVTQVSDNPGNSPAMTTSYTYEGDPAWAFDTGAFGRDEDEFGWSQWLGYGTTTVRKGSATTRVRAFRGWNNDLTLQQDGSGDWVPTGRRSVTVSTLDGSRSFVDDHPLVGRVLEEQQLGTLGGVANSVLQSRVHEYTQRQTATPDGTFIYNPMWVGLTNTTETVYTATNAYRQRRSQTAYNTNLQVTSTLEEGWLDTSGDERCTMTTYADNTAIGMVNYPAVNTKVAGACNSANVLTRTETYYDSNTTLGAAPTKGLPTRQRIQVDANRWIETNLEFDNLGRPMKATGPTGAITTAAYTMASGAGPNENPLRTVVTNALGHQETTELVPEFGVPASKTDANGNLTTLSYDEFGRLLAVWLPTEPIAFAEPSWRFAYDIPNRTVHTRRLTSDDRCCEAARFLETWVVYDGMWRPRQTQSASPVSGKTIVSETTYDSQGLVRDELVEQALSGSPGTYLSGGSSWLNRSRHSYDELGRKVRQDWLRGTAVAKTTTTAYTADTVTVTGPDGRKVRNTLDGLGRTVDVGEFDGTSWVSSAYEYDLADRLRFVTDPAGVKIENIYNMAGWIVGQNDPNRGGHLFEYDAAGRVTHSFDQLSNQLFTTYDALGRKKELRSGSPTGTLMADWQYDTAPGGKGKPHKETTYSSAGTWVSEVVGYDIKGRATGSKLTVPAGIAGLSGSYQVTQTYDRADRVRSVTYPAIGGLPAEPVTTDYNDYGLLSRVAGIDEYAWGMSYDDRGRRVSAGFGPHPSGTWMAKNWAYDLDQRLNRAQTYLSGAIVSDHLVAFDPAGNLKEDLTKQNGLSWLECYGYDARSRLTSAYTVASTADCAGGTPGTGDRAYSTAYQYSPDGRILSSGGRAYTYGTSQPDAPTKVGADAYSWDAKGRMTSRTIAGQAATLNWDAIDRLTSVTAPGGATTSFIYDASGNRLLRKTPDGKTTLYVAGHELTVNAGGTPVAAVRPYVVDGQLVATRTLSGVEYLVTDIDGSVELAAPAGGSVSASRAYDPYGKVRAQSGHSATDRGFVGQIEDATTGLSYLNARYYDASIGVFISADPIYDTSKVKTLNPYVYSSGNPTTYTDPNGTYSFYTWGVEKENAQLRQVNRQLIDHIGQLNAQIEQMQDVIRQQADAISQLLTYVDALEAEIARQASIIERLQARVAYLEHVVAVQQREITRLRRIVAYQAGVIQKQAVIIQSQKAVIAKLTARIIMDSIGDLGRRIGGIFGGGKRGGGVGGGAGGGGGGSWGGGGSGRSGISGWWTSNKGTIQKTVEGLELGLAGGSFAAWGSTLFGNPTGPLLGAGLGEAADFLNTTESVVFTVDTCFEEGWSSSECSDSAGQSLVSGLGSMFSPGFAGGTVLDAMTGGNTLLNDAGETLCGWLGC